MKLLVSLVVVALAASGHADYLSDNPYAARPSYTPPSPSYGGGSHASYGTATGYSNFNLGAPLSYGGGSSGGGIGSVGGLGSVGGFGGGGGAGGNYGPPPTGYGH
ncbi:hypothetical protein Hamer_G023089 [Homarus americanus]|uniref:Uncharacterized protein n=1 Tax=Homarus americanus TaxID=6706 RepID=A0A8J5N1Y3_HOMAM|nr:hypothetical protein Hamer_G023089 [Homarus americanus]